MASDLLFSLPALQYVSVFSFLWKKLRIYLVFGVRQTEELHNSLPRWHSRIFHVWVPCVAFCVFFLPLLALPSEGETDDSPVWPALHIMKPPTALQEAGGRSD